MNNDISMMLKLQTIWNQIIDYKRQIESDLKSIKYWEEEKNKLNQQILELKNQLKNLKAKIKDDENNLAEIEDRISKLEKNKENLKTQREFESFQNEIEKLNEERNQIEENLIIELDEQSNLEKELLDLEKQLPDKIKSIEKDIEYLKNKIDDHNEKVNTLVNDFNLKLNELSVNLRARFKKIIETKNIAIAKIENGTCQACHFKLPVYIKDEATKNKIINCSNCGRFLYI